MLYITVMIQWFILATVMKLIWLIMTMLVTIDLLSIFRLTSHHHHLITGHSVLIVIWKNMFDTFYGYITMLKMRDYKCRVCEMFPPRSTTEDHPKATFASETNVDARKYKWIAIIKFILLARFRCCIWTWLLRKGKLMIFNLQTLKLLSILQQWQLLTLSMTLNIK